MSKDDSMPLGSLTIGEFRALMSEILEASAGAQAEKAPRPGPRRYVYGLKGIERLLGVSHTMAQRYKDGILREAVVQNGRKIVTDADLALELFAGRGKDGGKG